MRVNLKKAFYILLKYIKKYEKLNANNNDNELEPYIYIKIAERMNRQQVQEFWQNHTRHINEIATEEFEAGENYGKTAYEIEELRIEKLRTLQIARENNHRIGLEEQKQIDEISKNEKIKREIYESIEEEKYKLEHPDEVDFFENKNKNISVAIPKINDKKIYDDKKPYKVERTVQVSYETREKVIDKYIIPETYNRYCELEIVDGFDVIDTYESSELIPSKINFKRSIIDQKKQADRIDEETFDYFSRMRRLEEQNYMLQEKYNDMASLINDVSNNGIHFINSLQRVKEMVAMRIKSGDFKKTDEFIDSVLYELEKTVIELPKKEIINLIKLNENDPIKKRVEYIPSRFDDIYYSSDNDI
jgi:hypothetical protein